MYFFLSGCTWLHSAALFMLVGFGHKYFFVGNSLEYRLSLTNELGDLRDCFAFSIKVSKRNDVRVFYLFLLYAMLSSNEKWKNTRNKF